MAVLPTAKNALKTRWNKPGITVLPLTKLISRAFQRYWRITRGLTIGVTVCLFDRDNRIVLRRRNGDGDGAWELPAGQVQNGETLEAALSRVLNDDALAISGRAQLLRIYPNHKQFPGDHVGLYVARVAPGPQPASKTASQLAFFPPDELPQDLDVTAATHIGDIISAGWHEKV